MERSEVVSYSIGYEGRDLDAFLRVLKRVGVDRVVDVRELPLSRRRGFSKTALREELASQGIEYVHLKCAGNPYRNQKDDIDRCLALYAKYLDAAPEIVKEVESALEGHRAALLCVEADHARCHRSVIESRLKVHNPKRMFRHL